MAFFLPFLGRGAAGAAGKGAATKGAGKLATKKTPWVGRKIVQFKALDVAGDFLSRKAKQAARGLIPKSPAMGVISPDRLLARIKSKEKTKKLKRPPGLRYLEVSEKEQKNELQDILRLVKKIPLIDLGEKAKDEIESEQQDIVDVSSVSPEVQKNFEVVGRQIKIIGRALVSSEKRITRFERFMSGKIQKVSEFQITNQQKLKKLVDWKVDTIHDSVRGFDDKITLHDTEIDTMRHELSFMKMHLARQKKEGGGGAKGRGTPRLPFDNKLDLKTKGALGLLGGAALAAYLLPKIISKMWPDITSYLDGAAGRLSGEMNKLLDKGFTAVRDRLVRLAKADLERLEKLLKPLTKEMGKNKHEESGRLFGGGTLRAPRNVLPEGAGTLFGKKIKEFFGMDDDDGGKKKFAPPMKLGGPKSRMGDRDRRDGGEQREQRGRSFDPEKYRSRLGAPSRKPFDRAPSGFIPSMDRNRRGMTAGSAAGRRFEGAPVGNVAGSTAAMNAMSQAGKGGAFAGFGNRGGGRVATGGKGRGGLPYIGGFGQGRSGTSQSFRDRLRRGGGQGRLFDPKGPSGGGVDPFSPSGLPKGAVFKNIPKGFGRNGLPSDTNYAERFPANTERFFRADGGLNVSPKLMRLMRASTKDLPPGYRMEMISGRNSRSTGTRNHPTGLAIDVKIYDDKGVLLKHGSPGRGFGVYERMYQSMRTRGEEWYPDEEFIWGGAWIGRGFKGDKMHFQHKKRGVGSQTSGSYHPDKGLGRRRWNVDPTNERMSPEEIEEYRENVRGRIRGIDPNTSPTAPTSPTSPSMLGGPKLGKEGFLGPRAGGGPKLDGFPQSRQPGLPKSFKDRLGPNADKLFTPKPTPKTRPLGTKSTKSTTREITSGGGIPKGTDQKVIDAINKVAKKHNLDPAAVSQVIKMESNFNPRNKTGSYVGMTQIGPDTMREAGWGISSSQFRRMPANKQIEYYGKWLDHYKFDEKVKKYGVDPSKMSASEQAAMLQAFQFSPNGNRWLRALGKGNIDTRATGSPQAGALGRTTQRDMRRTFDRRLSSDPAQYGDLLQSEQPQRAAPSPAAKISQKFVPGATPGLVTQPTVHGPRGPRHSSPLHYLRQDSTVMGETDKTGAWGGQQFGPPKPPLTPSPSIKPGYAGGMKEFGTPRAGWKGGTPPVVRTPTTNTRGAITGGDRAKAPPKPTAKRATNEKIGVPTPPGGYKQKEGEASKVVKEGPARDNNSQKDAGAETPGLQTDNTNSGNQIRNPRNDQADSHNASPQDDQSPRPCVI